MNFINKWCYSLDEEYYEGSFDSIEDAKGEAQCMLDDETDVSENGTTRYYWVGQSCHPLSKLTEAYVGADIIENINNSLYDIVSSDDIILDFSDSDVLDLGKLVLDFMKERAAVQVYALENITKHEYIIGSNE